MSTNIQWTDETDNIIVVKGGGWWCRMISPGCANCYAANINQNPFYGGNKLTYRGNAPEMELRTDVINGWAKQRKPKKHFVASMTDVFGDWVTQGMADAFLSGMLNAPLQKFQVLTKRPDVARDRIEKWLLVQRLGRLPENIWIGTSVEDQQRADERIPHLLNIPAKVRFLSVEPMLGPIDFDLAERNHKGELHWAIFGGESGTGARPCNVDWIRDGVRQCREAGVAPFVKQLGAKPVAPDTFHGTGALKDCSNLITDRKGGDMSEWPEDLRVREFPQ